MSLLQSTVLSEAPIIEGDSVTLPICRVGTKAYDANGKAYTLTQEALESGAETWEDGIITVNHMVKEKGKIAKSWFEDPFVLATFEGLSNEAVEAVNSKAYRGVSQESQSFSVDKDGNVTKLKGTGCTLVFYPHTPACPMKAGCGVPSATASAVMETDEGEKHAFDVCKLNNSGQLVKIGRISVWLFNDEVGSNEALLDGIAREVGYIGKGIFKIYDTENDEFEIGDLIPEELEPIHTVTMTVSNFPLYTPSGTIPILNSSGGTDLSEDENQIKQLESTVKQKDGLISTKEQEIEKLKSTVEKLENDLKSKDGQIESTVQAAVKAALESHDTQLKEQAEKDAATKELSSFMKEETLADFMKAEPSLAVIKSTTNALKASAGTNVGTGGVASTGETEEEVSLGVWDAAKQAYV